MGNQRDANEVALESSPLVGPLRQLLQERAESWSGTSACLLKDLAALAGEAVTKTKQWPKRPHILSGRLRRLAPGLRRCGIDVQFIREPGGNRDRTITLTVIPTDKTENQDNGASRSVPASRKGEEDNENEPSEGRSGTCRDALGDASKNAKPKQGTLRDARDAPLQAYSAGGQDNESVNPPGRGDAWEPPS
jgi:hypothetical protein